ncbi:PREDICTED: 4-coumarate--CoA ligase 1-like [Dinoponera quadriceps]|uniref:4-coumarate--CoA ligase 1-like n=1 Tax=Dinoponera quadriceps TaxID=609295 RepID=A0A6P3XCC7_DINQU|nr:PREDICTED: 4-coumarate--CoA ligase 1-like [Dinoponera quadriceps]
MMSRLPTLTRLSYILRNKCIERTQCGLKKFTTHRYYTTASRLKLDSQNVVSSYFPDVTGYENVYVHDFVWENIGKWPNKTAVVCSVSGRTYTYSQLRKTCARLATSFRKCNLLPGDKLAVILPNIPEFMIVALAASEAGMTLTMINPAYTVYEIKRYLELSDAKAVITWSAKYADAQASVRENPNIKLPIIIANDSIDSTVIPGTIKLTDLMRDDIEEFSVSQKTGVSFEADVYMPFSSGTTGLSKGVQLSHRNIVANLQQIIRPELYGPVEATESYQDIIPLILPLFHIFGLILSMNANLRLGNKLVCVPQFSQDGFIKLLEQYRPTHLQIVPPIVQILAYNKRITPRHVENMKTIVSGAAPIGDESISMFQDRISDSVIFCQGYGMTETSPAISLSCDGAPTASCGYLISSSQMRIVGENDDNRDKNLGPRELGQIYVRGPHVMKGYFKNPEKTAETMDGDWIKTGDIGYYTEEGLIYVQGRLKEMIKVKGLQVAPAELEEVIRACDKIQDVGVIGVSHDKYGEIPKAFVVPKKGIKIDEDELKKFVAERVAEFKQLGYVQVVESIPKSATGKILRKKLEEL